MRVQVRASSEAPRCAFCHDDFRGSERVACNRCGSTYHAECAADWRCASLGCGGRVRKNRSRARDLPQWWTISREGFIAPELVVRGHGGREIRIRGNQILERGAKPMYTAASGCCGRVHTLRDAQGRLVATAFPTAGFAGGGYRVVARRERFALEHQSEGWFRSPLVVTRDGRQVLRFESTFLAQDRKLGELEPLEPALLGFFVYLERLIRDTETAAATAAIIAVS